MAMLLILVAAICFDATTAALQGRKVRHDISTPSTTEARIVFPDRGSQIKFPEKQVEPLSAEFNESNSNQIPVALFLKHTIKGTKEFIEDFVINKVDLQSAMPSSSLPGNGSILMRANSGVRTNDVAIMAQCEPQLTPVELEKSSDPAVIYFPSCTRVERCGGCCMHDLLVCEPIRNKTIQVKVFMARYIPGNEGFHHEGFKTLELEKHLACECKCRTKEEDCNLLQEYKPNECKCVCKNGDDIKQCVGEHRFWDPRTCSCHCRNVRECSTGFFFDSTTCSCQPQRNSPVFRMPAMTFRMRSRNPYQSSWDFNRRHTSSGDDLVFEEK